MESETNPYGQCLACEALYSAPFTRDPHEHMDLGWRDPVNLAMSVYICRVCHSLCVQDLSDPAERWK
jgi:hypothetical protein